MIEDKFIETIQAYNLFQPGELVLVAVSGGADSTALLNLLYDRRSELGISLHAVHLNHMLRKTEAELDLKYVEGLTQKMGIPITSEAIDVAAVAEREGGGIEENARKVRYDFFERVAERLGAAKIVVGHTADDNVETFLMRLLRGAGLKGLCGIPPRRGRIVRPLIKIWRREIEDYVGSLKLVPRRDHTNYESRYMRNSVRLKLIPQLKLYNLNIKEIILQTILLLTEDHFYIENQTENALDGIILSAEESRIKLDNKKLRALDPPLPGHVLRKALEKIKGNLRDVSFQHIQDLTDKVFDEEKWELHLPGGLFAYGEKESLTFSREKKSVTQSKPFLAHLSIPGEVYLPEINKTLRAQFVKEIVKYHDQSVAFFDYATLGKETIVRSRQPGDRFSPLGISGTKKIQDYLVDEKIPAEERDLVPIVESGGRIVWVGGWRIDERAKVTDNTTQIVKMELL